VHRAGDFIDGKMRLGRSPSPDSSEALAICPAPLATCAALSRYLADEDREGPASSEQNAFAIVSC